MIDGSDHPLDSIRGTNPEDVCAGVNKPPRKKYRKEIRVGPRTEVSRITPDGEKVFLFKTGPVGTRKTMVELYLGDRLNYLKPKQETIDTKGQTPTIKTESENIED